MVKKKTVDIDVRQLEASEKIQRIIQCFLEIECSPTMGCTPQQAKTLRKKIIDEVKMALRNVMFYDGDRPDPKEPIPLWHKLFIAGHDTEGRTKSIRYLLRFLGRQIRTSDNRTKPYWLS